MINKKDLHLMVFQDERNMQEIADQAGVSRRTMEQWFYVESRIPPIDKFQKVLNTLGYKLEVVKNETN